MAATSRNTPDATSSNALEANASDALREHASNAIRAGDSNALAADASDAHEVSTLKRRVCMFCILYFSLRTGYLYFYFV